MWKKRGFTWKLLRFEQLLSEMSGFTWKLLRFEKLLSEFVRNERVSDNFNVLSNNIERIYVKTRGFPWKLWHFEPLLSKFMGKKAGLRKTYYVLSNWRANLCKKTSGYRWKIIWIRLAAGGWVWRFCRRLGYLVTSSYTYNIQPAWFTLTKTLHPLYFFFFFGYFLPSNWFSWDVRNAPTKQWMARLWVLRALYPRIWRSWVGWLEYTIVCCRYDNTQD